MRPKNSSAGFSAKKNGIKSMTGFGKASEKSPFGTITVEIKTLNHKNLSITCNSFSNFFLLEEKLQRVVEEYLYRGKAFIRIAREDAGAKESLKKVCVNERLAKEYISRVKEMQKKFKIKGEISIKDLISLPGVIESYSEDEADMIWPHIEKTLRKAIHKLLEYRASEGARLAKDFAMRLAAIIKRLQKIKKYEKQSIMKFRNKLVDSIREVGGGIQPDKTKLESEVALFANNCDIAEELTRLEGHSVAFRESVEKIGEDAGKRLDFIAQEMQREANTIGAKSNDFRISQEIIDVKSEIEKIREQ
ncbi:MAG: YicC family protein, partial [Candidatus Omnitrophica bacterium]|nr:YicC family protein [Candidatus Omnitrophota bacterium]